MLRLFIHAMQVRPAPPRAPVIEAVRVPPIGLDHVAIDGDLALAEALRGSTAARSEAADQPAWISTVRPALLAGGGPRGRGAFQRGRAGSMPYSAVNPAAALAPSARAGSRSSSVGRDPARGCVAEFHHAGTFGVFDHAAFPATRGRS